MGLPPADPEIVHTWRLQNDDGQVDVGAFEWPAVPTVLIKEKPA
jgi:hypothetical protein